MLELNPEARISAQEALSHEYLRNVEIWLNFMIIKICASLEWIEGSHQPKTLDYLTSDVSELSPSIRLIILEITSESLSVGKIQCSLTVLNIIFEVPFIFDPVLSKILEVTEIKLSI